MRKKVNMHDFIPSPISDVIIFSSLMEIPASLISKIVLGGPIEHSY